ncbi:hypothetical protein AUJ10_01155 [Candidatus Pacearchaeota archaeon CG1_02_31_27]|nr:MAG: hypothetical protein AUJ10_01155 [Candidatus Pacearchaeota archaeon CG1_02_31_27]
MVFCNGNESLEFFNEGIQEEIPELKIEAYNRAIEINPYFTRAYFNRGIIYYNLNNYEKAIDDLTKVLKFESENIRAYYFRGLAYNYLGKYKNAIDDLNKAIELNPVFLEAYDKRGLIYYYRIKDLQKAINDFTMIINLDPELALAYYNRGIIYLDLNCLDKAFEDVTKYIEIKETDSKGFFIRSLMFIKRGDFEKAVEDINKAIKLGPINYQYYVLKGDINYFVKGDYKAAIDDYKQAINLVLKAQLEDIFEHTTKFINHENEDIAEFLVNKISGIYYEIDDYNNALLSYDKFLHITKKSLINQKKIVYNLILNKKGNYKNVIKNISILVRDNCLSETLIPFYYYCLGEAYYGINKLSYSENNLKKISKLNKKFKDLSLEYDAKMLLIEIYKELNKKEEVNIIVNDLKYLIIKKMKKEPISKWLWNEKLAKLYASSNIFSSDALKLIIKTIEVRRCWDSYYTLGFVYYNIENYTMAVRAFEKAQALNPNNVWIWYYLGLARKGLKQMKAAKYAWEQGLKINPNHRFIKEELKKIR